MTGVGTLGESPLHAGLKAWYAEPGDRVEEPVDGFVVDIVRDDLLIEIQTRSFSSMKRKLQRLLETHAVRIIHPIAVDRFIIKVGEGGEVVSRRRSPKHGVPVDLFGELKSFPGLVAHENFDLEVVMTVEEEVRVHDPSRGGWRRGGWVTDDRRLLEVQDRLTLGSPAALASLLPASLPEEFTTAELAGAIGRPRRLAQQMAYCLRHAGVLEVIGKRGNAHLHTRSDAV